MSYYSLISMMPKGGSSYDPDAQAFFTAAGITDNTQKTAVNQLVLDLKSYSIWTKMKAVYPFVGGTSTTHKYNLKDPQDTDGAFRLVFSGGWTHSSTGALPNGTNAYADTKLNPNNTLTAQNAHGSIYARTANVTGSVVDRYLFGAWDFFAIDSYSTTNYEAYLASIATISQYLDYNQFSATPRHTGLLSITAQSNATNDHRLFHNSSKLKSGTLSTTSKANSNIYISALNLSGGVGWSNQEVSYASFGDGLSDTDVSNLYTAVQAFQTTLSRNV